MPDSVLPRVPADLSLFELIVDAPGHLLRMKRTMIAISHALEAAAAQAGRPCRVFVGFQRFSLLQQEAQRYRALTPAWEHAWVFGVPDVAPPALPNVTPVPIAAHHTLAREWFVIIDSPTFGAALLTADLSGFAVSSASRRFVGVWTSDAALVRAASTRLLHALDLPPCDWEIDGAASLATFTQMSNELVALYEERALTAQRLPPPEFSTS